MAPSCSGHHDGTGRGVGGEKNGGKMAEEMSGDSIKTQQTSADTPRQSACQLLLTSVPLAEPGPRRLTASSGGYATAQRLFEQAALNTPGRPTCSGGKQAKEPDTS